MPVLLDLGQQMVSDDVPLFPTQLWGYDVVKMAIIDGSLYMYLKVGQQSQDSWATLNRELIRAIEQIR